MTTGANDKIANIEPSDHTYSFKIVLVGDSHVGKTSICKRFCHGTFDETFVPTVGLEFGSKIVEVDGVRVKLQIWDTAGQERFNAITRAYFRSSAGVFLVYDISNRDSFTRVAKWTNDAVQLSPQSSIKVLIGNKSDLESQRAVSTVEAQEFADQHSLKFFETSALSGDKIEECFIKATYDIHQQIKSGVIDLNTPNTGAQISTSHERPLTIGQNESRESSCNC